jgi:hypothetical protein
MNSAHDGSLRLLRSMLAAAFAVAGLTLAACVNAPQSMSPAWEGAQQEADDSAHTPEAYDAMEDNMPEMENAK